MENKELIKTPYFIVSEKKLEENLKLLDKIQKEANIQIIQALKAFSTPYFLEQINKTLKGATASSLNEARLANEYYQEVHIYSPAYKKEEIKELATIGTHITFNSLSQYLTHKNTVLTQNPDIKIGIRLNPEQSEVTYALYDPCCPHSRLGITEKEINRSQLDQISGIHIHNLCGKREDSLKRTLDSIQEKFPWILNKIEWINLGGGHALTYEEYNHEKLIEYLKAFKKKYKLNIIMEPGEAVVYKTGKLVAKVIDVVHNEMDIAILDTTASAHMPDIIEMPYRPNIEGAGFAYKKKHTYRLGGITCLAGDIMGDYSFDKPITIGDHLIFDDMAHYTMVKTTWFNGINLPSIVKENENGSVEILREYNYDDYKRQIS